MSTMAYQIAGLLEKMSSTDKDYRFMATNDLMNELQNDSIKLDDDSERKVCVLLHFWTLLCSPVKLWFSVLIRCSCRLFASLTLIISDLTHWVLRNSSEGGGHTWVESPCEKLGHSKGLWSSATGSMWACVSVAVALLAMLARLSNVFANAN